MLRFKSCHCFRVAAGPPLRAGKTVNGQFQLLDSKRHARGESNVVHHLFLLAVNGDGGGLSRVISYAGYVLIAERVVVSLLEQLDQLNHVRSEERRVGKE